MRKIALIPTRDPKSAKDLEDYFVNAGWTPYFLSGYKSIFDAYSDGMKIHSIEAKDKIILCHDDIDILTEPKYFNKFIDDRLDDSNTGFLGIAGTRMMSDSCIWWEGIGSPGEALNRLSGFAMHGDISDVWHMNYYGSFGQVAILDGVFLCATGALLNQIQLTKPKDFEGDWDFYDVFYTAQAHLKGKHNHTVPIQILHRSPGKVEGRDSWHKNRLAFREMFSDKFPIFVA